MIDLWPAIDSIDSTSIRLTEGKYDTKEKMEKSVEDSIRLYNQFKCVKHIYIVDLIGTKAKEVKEFNHIRSLRKATIRPIEMGDGIRSKRTIKNYIHSGIDYCIVDTEGVQDIEWLTYVTHQLPNKLYLSIDASGEKIKINGWKEDAKLSLFNCVAKIEHLPLGGVIYIDISKDERLSGPNFDLTSRLVPYISLPVIASGGIRHQEDLFRLESLNVHAAIVGEAAYLDEFWEGLS